MGLLNHHYLKLRAGYLFPEIARRVNAFSGAHPDAAKRLIRCGIGDVTEPLPSAVITAMHAAVDELGARATFRGYGPEQGYDFLRNAIATHDYRARGIEIAPDEIFISDGSKCDTGNILDILSAENVIGVPDPVYPVYVDTNVMAGNTGEADASGTYQGLHYLRGTPENGFVPDVPGTHLDVVYLCFPNNPTGSVATRAQLTKWVEYARANDALILFDAAYEAYICDPQIPHSIYEIDGARDCAIEFRSFSKNGGFTGTRCAFTVVPKNLLGRTPDGQRQPLHPLWHRRMTTKFNGVSYVVQRGAEALYTDQGKAEVASLLKHYMGNAAVLREAIHAIGLDVWGGVNAPYLWARTPGGASSWEFFDRLLTDAQVVITPGSGFGSAGEGFFRISAFNSRNNVEEVARRLKSMN
jgi:LL-diaminopimelate aminotransferase